MTLLGPLRYEHPPHLPPPHVAPILENYNHRLKRVDDDSLLEAPLDKRGVVDIFRTVELALSLVDEDYIWPRASPQPDTHHFVWERDWYHPRHFNGSSVPRDYRDKIPFHKGYMPRQLHHFIHATIAPPPVPDFSVMEQRVEHFGKASVLFERARGAVTARRRPSKITGVPICPDTGRVSLDDEILMQIMTNFEGSFEESKAHISSDNEFIAGYDLIQQTPEAVARCLGKIAAQTAVNLMPIVYGNRKNLAASGNVPIGHNVNPMIGESES